MFVFVRGFICCKQQMIWLRILIQPAVHSLFIGEFRPWVFIVTIKWYAVFPIFFSFYDTCFFACLHLLVYTDKGICVCCTFLNCLCFSSIFIIPLSIFYCVHLFSWISLVLFTSVRFHFTDMKDSPVRHINLGGHFLPSLISEFLLWNLL
jgi:hypothetical protein